MKAWQVTRWTLLALFGLLVALGLARAFSGSEDTWIRDGSGRWVAHGHPSGPPPPASYQPPRHERVLPVLLMAAFAAGVAAAVLFSPRAPASVDNLNRNLRFWGAAGILASALAVILLLALTVTVAFEHGRLAAPAMPGPHLLSVFDQPAAVLFVLLGLAAFLGLLGATAYVIRKVLEAHYDLRRQAALLQDAVDRLNQRCERRPQS
jgi:hypothetical protein